MPALAALAIVTGMAGAAPAAGLVGPSGPGSGGPVAHGPVAHPAALTGCTWSVTSTTLGATGVTYTFAFSTAAAIEVITSVTLTVPPGTSGTPGLDAASTPPGLLVGSTITLTGSTLHITGVSLSLGPQAFNIIVHGLTNTTTAGTDSSVMTTVGVGGDTGTSNTLTFGIPDLTSPATLGWSATLTGTDLSLVDATTGDQQLTVADVESVGAGWNITVTATTFTGTAGSLADVGTFILNGSLSSVTSMTKPTATCVTSCTTLANGTTYPVGITTAASSPVPARIFSAAASGATGTFTIGGQSSAGPIGWWVNIPGNARAGSYASTVTIAIASGP